MGKVPDKGHSGGFGNNYVDDGEVKRYREYDSMSVFEINAISARKATGFRKDTKQVDDEIMLSLKTL